MEAITNLLDAPDGAPGAPVLELHPKASADPMSRCMTAYAAARGRAHLEILAERLRDDPMSCLGGRPKRRIWRRTT